MHRFVSLAICLACTPVPPCDTLAVEPCAERAECTTITAWTVTGTDEEACVDYDAARVAVGCMEAGVGCDDIVVRSTDPNDPDAPEPPTWSAPQEPLAVPEPRAGREDTRDPRDRADRTDRERRNISVRRPHPRGPGMAR